MIWPDGMAMQVQLAYAAPGQEGVADFMLLSDQGFSNFFYVLPIFFGCVCIHVPPLISGNIIMFHDTRASAISCVAEIWIHSSLVAYYNYYSTTVTTLLVTTTVSTHCDCYYFRYCHNEWLNIRLNRQCHVFVLRSKCIEYYFTILPLLSTIFLVFPGSLWKKSTFYLPSIVPPVSCNCTTSGTCTTVWEMLV